MLCSPDFEVPTLRKGWLGCVRAGLYDVASIKQN